MIAEVAVNRPINKVFDYHIPDNLIKYIKIGQRVHVSFARKRTIAFVVALKEKSDFKKLSSIEGLVDVEAIYTQALLELTKKVADYYFCSWGQMLEAGVPFALKSKKSIIKNFDKVNPACGANSKSVDKTVFKEVLYSFNNSREKIEIYKKIIQETSKGDKKILLLSPDAFGVEYLRRELEGDLSGELICFSSQQSQKLNKINLEKLYDDKASVIIGTRSCVFLDIKKLGLIILEQEESEFYKRPDTPRYDARQAALFRAQAADFPLIKASINLSLKTYYQAKEKNIQVVNEPKTKPLIKNFQLIDLNEEEDITTRKKFMSFRFQEALKKCLDNKKQALIVFNRRGFASIIKCQKCQHILTCPRCDCILSYHYDKKTAVCHHCNYTREVPKICPACKKAYVKFFGHGTQKLQSNLAYLFPNAKIERLDLDEASQIKDRFKIIDAFNKGRIDFLIGTQILGAGIDFTNTDCLATLSLESLIKQNDFRGMEKAFSFMFTLLNEYYSASKNPNFLIQTFLSKLKALEFLKNNDYESFLEFELEERKDLKLPPLFSLSKVHLRSQDKLKVQKASSDLVNRLNEVNKKDLIINPRDASDIFIYRHRETFATSIDIKAKKLETVKAALDKVLTPYKTPSKVLIIIELDAV